MQRTILAAQPIDFRFMNPGSFEVIFGGEEEDCLRAGWLTAYESGRRKCPSITSARALNVVIALRSDARMEHSHFSPQASRSDWR